MKSSVTALVIKEIRAVLKDKKMRLTLIIPPIIQLFIFAFAATLDVKNVPIGILNRDNGEKAFELVQRFHGSRIFSHIIYLNSVDEITPFIDNQRGLMVVSIDEQFSRNLDAKKPAQVQLILDGRRSNTTQILAGYTASIVDQYNQDISLPLDYVLQNTQIEPYNFYNPNLLYYWYNVPSLAGILTMLVALTITSQSVAREREMGTFDQLLVSPLTPIQILIGKSLPAIIIALAESGIIVFSGIFIFQIPFIGSLATLYLGLFVFVCSIIGIGLFISSLCSTQQQAILGTFCFMSPAVLLSGFATPIENMPQALQYVTYAIPLRYILVIARGEFLKGMPFVYVLDNIWPMIVISLFTFSGAAWLFRKRIG
jgi:ABC-2 type transport system permease protein